MGVLLPATMPIGTMMPSSAPRWGGSGKPSGLQRRADQRVDENAGCAGVPKCRSGELEQAARVRGDEAEGDVPLAQHRRRVDGDEPFESIAGWKISDDGRVLKLRAGRALTDRRSGQRGNDCGDLRQTRGPHAGSLAGGGCLAWANVHENLRGQEPRTSRPHLVAQLTSSTGTPIYISVEIRVKAGILTKFVLTKSVGGDAPRSTADTAPTSMSGVGRDSPSPGGRGSSRHDPPGVRRPPAPRGRRRSVIADRRRRGRGRNSPGARQ